MISGARLSSGRAPDGAGREERLCAENDEVRGAGELERPERGLGGAEQRDHADARGDGPDGEAERDAGGRRDPAPAPARERVPDRERRVLAGRADDHDRHGDEGGEASEHPRSIARRLRSGFSLPAMLVVKQSELPWSSIANELVGAEHGLDITLLFVDAEPGKGPALHRHPYPEIFITLEGEATFTGRGRVARGAGRGTSSSPMRARRTAS